MPLKIGFVGDRLSGKSSIANKIAAKYGIMIIDPKTILKESFELNKEPVVEDPKKKKDLKKPEEENPEKIALKEFGEKMMRKLDSP
jgi:dephospho-CoA kinase